MQAHGVAVFYLQDPLNLGKSTDTEWGVCSSYRGSCLRWGKLKIPLWSVTNVFQLKIH